MASCSTRSLKGIGQCPHSRNGTAKSSGGSWCCLFVRWRWRQRQRRMLLLFHANNPEENTPVVARSGLQVELAPETGDYKCNRGCGILYASFLIGDSLFMRKLMVALVLSLAVALAAMATPGGAVRCGKLLDVRNGQLLTDQVVTFDERGIITSVASATSKKATANERFKTTSLAGFICLETHNTEDTIET